MDNSAIPSAESEDLSDIWDDESGTPSPMTAAEMDRRLMESTARLREERLLIEAQTAELAQLVSRYTTVLQRLEEVEKTEETSTKTEATLRLRTTLLQLAEQSASVALSL